MNRFLVFSQLILFGTLHSPVRTFPSCYEITKVVSHNTNLNIGQQGVFQICRTETDEEFYNLIEYSDKTASYSFHRNEFEFFSMIDEQVEFKVFKPENIEWYISSSFASTDLAQEFYEEMNTNRDEPVFVVSAAYLSAVIDEENRRRYLTESFAAIHCHYFNGEITVVVYDDDGKPLLIFPKERIYRIEKNYPSYEVHLTINQNSNLYEYAFGCMNFDEIDSTSSIFQEIKDLNIINIRRTRFLTSPIKEIIQNIGSDYTRV